MKWVEKRPVKEGDLVQLTVLGVSGTFMALCDAADVLDLKLKELRLVKEDVR